VAYRVRSHRDHHRDHRSGVLGQVAGHLPGRQLPRLVLAGRDVADIELLTPAGIAARPTIVQRWAGHPDDRDGLAQGVLEEGGGERLRWGARQAGQRQAVAASRRRTAWRWMAPRRWNSATLA